MAKSNLSGLILRMMPGREPGSWQPASVHYRRLLRRVQQPREGDPVNHPHRDKVEYLIAMCASRGVSVVFDPATRAAEGPSPAPLAVTPTASAGTTPPAPRSRRPAS